jgi:hypothetical protein
MQTVNSLSGGKTSSYLAIHYPADYELFALVCVDDHNAGKDLPRWLVQKVNDRLQKTSAHWPEFRATTEDPKTITAILDLEQMIGREIIFLRGMGWEEMMKNRKAVPNRQRRFCTSVMKIQPIFEYCYLNTNLPIEMRIGYRYDELERADTFTTQMKYATHCEYQPGSSRWIHRWSTIEWRVGRFPLIEDKVLPFQIQNFWASENIAFPEDSNCQNCFWKPEQQLRKNMETNRTIMQWAKVQEEIFGYTFRDEYSLLEIEKMGIQQDFAFGVGSGCQAGFCTD